MNKSGFEKRRLNNACGWNVVILPSVKKRQEKPHLNGFERKQLDIFVIICSTQPYL